MLFKTVLFSDTIHTVQKVNKKENLYKKNHRKQANYGVLIR